MTETAGRPGQFQSLPEVREFASSAKRRAILVLSAHRSGTSAVAGVINAFGVTLPKKTLMGPHECNERGLFESFALAVAHDELLAAAGSHWHDWRQFDPRWLRSGASEQHRRKIKTVLVEEFDDEPFILIKDPRICRFVPLMSTILAELSISPIAVLPVRNPLEVAYSLRRRNGFGLAKSTLLWLRHMLDAEFHSRGMPRCFLAYEELLIDWRRHVDRIVERTGVVWPDRSDRSNAQIDQFLTTELRHQRASVDGFADHPEVTSLARDVHGILMDLVAGGESRQSLDQLDLVRIKFDEGCQIFGPAVATDELAAADSGVIAERDSLAAAHNRLISEHDLLVRDRDSLAAERDRLVVVRDELISERDALARNRETLAAERDALNAAYASLGAARDAMLMSRSWRLTAPLRSASRLVGGIRGGAGSLTGTHPIMEPRQDAPAVSVIVVVHNMAREAPRTLHSLSARYQRQIKAEDYEVIVVDNGSSPPLDAKLIDGLAGNFRLIRLDPAPPSPARAINRGLAEARGQVIGVMIDGARIATPGLLHFARHGVQLYPRAVVATLGWYLGRDQQRWAMECGYDQDREDELLASIGWPQDGYRLFEIGAFDESSADGWFAPIAESNALFLSRESWQLLGGVEERFDAAGGGYINCDTLIRAGELPGSEFVFLLGEATFHQFHHGIATNADYRTFPPTLAKWQAQYEAIRGRPLVTPSQPNRTYLGALPSAVLPHLARSIVEPARGLPLGPSFDRALWSPARWPRPADAVCAALLDLAESEFRHGRFEASAVVARMARAQAPAEPGPQGLLAHAGLWLRGKDPPDDRRAGFHLARALACRMLQDTAAAETEFRAALAWNPNMAEAHLGLAALHLPGEDSTTPRIPQPVT